MNRDINTIFFSWNDYMKLKEALTVSETLGRENELRNRKTPFTIIIPDKSGDKIKMQYTRRGDIVDVCVNLEQSVVKLQRHSEDAYAFFTDLNFSVRILRSGALQLECLPKEQDKVKQLTRLATPEESTLLPSYVTARMPMWYMWFSPYAVLASFLASDGEFHMISKDDTYYLAENWYDCYIERFVERKTNGWDVINLKISEMYEIIGYVMNLMYDKKEEYLACKEQGIPPNVDWIKPERMLSKFALVLKDDVFKGNNPTKVIQFSNDGNLLNIKLFFSVNGRCIEYTYQITNKEEFYASIIGAMASGDEIPINGCKCLLSPANSDSPFKEWEKKKIHIEETRSISNKTLLVANYVIINMFMSTYSPDVFAIDEKVAQQRGGHGHRQNDSKRVIRIFKLYTLKRNWKTTCNRKKAVFTCPSWGVRGHMRHYKNGKTVYVRPHIKGKDRERYVGKEYQLLPKG